MDPGWGGQNLPGGSRRCLVDFQQCDDEVSEIRNLFFYASGETITSTFVDMARGYV